LVLVHRGQVRRVDVQAAAGMRFALADGLEVELLPLPNKPEPPPADPNLPLPPPEPFDDHVFVRLHRGDKASPALKIDAHRPYASDVDPQGEVHAALFVPDRSAARGPMAGGRSRIDLLQGPLDEQGRARLYRRYWKPREGRVVFAEEISPAQLAGGESFPAFEMPIGKLEMRVREFYPADRTGEIVMLPLKTSKRDVPINLTRAARVRLAVDDRPAKERTGPAFTVDAAGRATPAPGVVVTEKWLVASDAGPDEMERSIIEAVEQRREPPRHDQKFVVAEGPRRIVRLAMPWNRIELGFQIRLDDFQMQLDPGTSQASSYASSVRFRGLDDRALAPKDAPVLISMNAPVDFVDPATQRSYRLFQESYAGPFLPGDATFDDNVPSDDLRPELYSSTLTVNYDPGRAAKMIGCLLVTAGIAVMFYMRAYFFTSPEKWVARPAAKTKRPAPDAAALRTPKRRPVEART
jgi:hypothetical protein